VLEDTSSHGLYDRVWPPHTIERRGGGGGCEQGGWRGGEGRARRSLGFQMSTNKPRESSSSGSSYSHALRREGKGNLSKRRSMGAGI